MSKEKFQVYFIKNPDGQGGVAKCPKTGLPLIAPYTLENKQKLEYLLKDIIEEYPLYSACFVSSLHEK